MINPNSDEIAVFEDPNYENPPPYVRVTSSQAWGIVILIARTAGDDGEPGPTAPVVFHRAEFAKFVGSVLANADPALRADIEIAAGNITASRDG